jgi:protein required for attachment to host cells
MWIAVADSAGCRLFAADGPSGPLREIEDLSHPEARLPERDLVSDLPGRAFDSKGAGRHAMEVQVSPKKQEAINFAGRVVQRLEAGRTKNEFDKLALVAAPEFLGLLREKLNPQLRALVVHELGKNLVREDARAIRASLPEKLYSSL